MGPGKNLFAFINKCEWPIDNFKNDFFTREEFDFFELFLNGYTVECDYLREVIFLIFED